MGNVFSLGFMEAERRKEEGWFEVEDLILPEDFEAAVPVSNAEDASGDAAGSASYDSAAMAKPAPGDPTTAAEPETVASSDLAPDAVEKPVPDTTSDAASHSASVTESAASGSESGSNPDLVSGVAPSPVAKSGADVASDTMPDFAPLVRPYPSPRTVSRSALAAASSAEEDGPDLYWPESPSLHRARRSYTIEEYYRLPRCGISELIRGKLCPMPLPDRAHQQILSRLQYAISGAFHAGSIAASVWTAPFSVNLFPAKGDTVVHPDLCVVCGKEKLDARGCKGAPDWVMEITSPENPVHDYYDKLMLYGKAGVREYWIINPEHKNVMVYSMRKDGQKFDLQAYQFQDRILSGLFEGVAIDMGEITADL